MGIEQAPPGERASMRTPEPWLEGVTLGGSNGEAAKPICTSFIRGSVAAPRSPLGRAKKLILNATNALGGGIHKWYQSERQALKLFNEYTGF
jgi:hypothetical protein